MSRVEDHTSDCDWHLDQYDAECSCGGWIKSATKCPKCALEAKTLLHRFCQHADCPVRSALAKENGGAA